MPPQAKSITHGQYQHATTRVPLSLEELLRKKAEEKNAVVKPVFLSKAERQKLALERREQEVAEQRRRIDSERQATAAFFSDAATTRTATAPAAVDRFRDRDRGRGDWDKDRARGGRDGRDRDRGWDRGRDRDRERDRERDRAKERSQPQPVVPEKRPAEDLAAAGVIQIESEEMSAIRNRYMGVKQERRKIQRMSEKKFMFEWDEAEDTSKDANPIYAKRHEAQLYGRGLIAGIDIKEQKKERAGFYGSMLKDRLSEVQLDRAQELREMEKDKERKTAFDERHWSEKPLSEMKDRDWRIFKEDFSISTKGGNIPNPLRSWKESNLPLRIKDIIASIGYTEPTPIQRQAIPIGLQNRDIIGVAETGSGKTASFVIPMLVFIMEMPPITEFNMSQGPYALILAPTRELAQQIEVETSRFAREMGFTCVAMVGGHAIEEQAVKLRNGAHIIIATPGRLKDALERRILVLSQCTYVVMDEADRMVDLGFENDLNFILDQMPLSNIKPDTDDAESREDLERLRLLTGADKRFRQTVMFSATMPPAVERLAKKYLRRPVTVTIGVAGQIVERIEQRVEMINDDAKKIARLNEILSSGKFEPPVIVFVNSKRGCEVLAKAIGRIGFQCTTLHSDKSQEQREASLLSIRQGIKHILVATDVAGRGIDVKDVSLVVNFDMAKNIEDYTHRIGRTGRAGKNGVAITFLSSSDTDVMYDLRQMILKSPISRVPPELARHEAAQVKPSIFKTKMREEQ
ncbi:mRNA splicing protein prp28 [Polyrhizophydium stewartii]|uniref:RNA helicase n=1 Tax=Polyrhizophydium stewartii TaxID=2732419 RepID=A0ABR4N7C3_9FUNG